MNLKRRIYLFAVIIITLIGLSYGVIYLINNLDSQNPYEQQLAIDGKQNYLLKDIDFSNGQWRLEFNSLMIDNGKVLNEFKDDLVITEESAAYFTTPEYQIQLFQNGKCIKSVPVEHIEKVDFGRLKPYMK